MPEARLRGEGRLLAAGHGTRLRPLTDRMPKCMVDVGGKPVLEHSVIWLRDYGVTDLIVNLSHLASVVTDYFGDGRKWNVRITYSLEDRALGTAGGVKQASWFFDGPFFLWYGDNMSTCRLDRLWAQHTRYRSSATIALFHRAQVSGSGIVS